MKVEKLQPNHICNNPNCTKGEDGGPKHYYACNYCNRTQSWRSFYCCKECFLEMQKIKANKAIKPQRTDITEVQYEELMSTPIEEVKKETLEELSDYKEYLEENGLDKTIDLINEQIVSGDQE